MERAEEADEVEGRVAELRVEVVESGLEEADVVDARVLAHSSARSRSTWARGRTRRCAATLPECATMSSWPPVPQASESARSNGPSSTSSSSQLSQYLFVAAGDPAVDGGLDQRMLRPLRIFAGGRVGVPVPRADVLRLLRRHAGQLAHLLAGATEAASGAARHALQEIGRRPHRRPGGFRPRGGRSRATHPPRRTGRRRPGSSRAGDAGRAAAGARARRVPCIRSSRRSR